MQERDCCIPRRSFKLQVIAVTQVEERPTASDLRYLGRPLGLDDGVTANKRKRSAMAAMKLNARIGEVTERIAKRSYERRSRYLEKIKEAATRGPKRGALGCSNLAHGFAACNMQDKSDLKGNAKANIAIISSYNDMLSAHQPFERFPGLIKDACRGAGAVAQFAGGVPAMCDGVTQGQPGMELSLFSRDVIAMASAVALSHDMFDGAIFLGVCDKIVPGLVMAALSFGHLPTVFIPAGPMTSGLANDEKAKVRQAFAQGKVSRDALLMPRVQHITDLAHALLRHREHQSDAHGNHGIALARCQFRQSGHAFA